MWIVISIIGCVYSSSRRWVNERIKDDNACRDSVQTSWVYLCDIMRRRDRCPYILWTFLRKKRIAEVTCTWSRSRTAWRVETSTTSSSPGRQSFAEPRWSRKAGSQCQGTGPTGTADRPRYLHRAPWRAGKHRWGKCRSRGYVLVEVVTAAFVADELHEWTEPCIASCICQRQTRRRR